MRRLKKFVFSFTLLGSTIALPACSSVVIRDVRDAAITGVASFVEGTVFDLLDALVNATVVSE